MKRPDKVLSVLPISLPQIHCNGIQGEKLFIQGLPNRQHRDVQHQSWSAVGLDRRVPPPSHPPARKGIERTGVPRNQGVQTVLDQHRPEEEIDLRAASSPPGRTTDCGSKTPACEPALEVAGTNICGIGLRKNAVAKGGIGTPPPIPSFNPASSSEERLDGSRDTLTRAEPFALLATQDRSYPRRVSHVVRNSGDRKGANLQALGD